MGEGPRDSDATLGTPVLLHAVGLLTRRRITCMKTQEPDMTPHDNPTLRGTSVGARAGQGPRRTLTHDLSRRQHLLSGVIGGEGGHR